MSPGDLRLMEERMRERFELDLPNALTRDAKLHGQILQSQDFVSAQPETTLDDIALLVVH